MELYREVMAELAKQDADPDTVALVGAALSGKEDVERVLAGESIGLPARASGEAEDRVPSVYLQDITVSGFRGIGPEVTLEIPPGPGLTVVVGRNGSGKSSFADALEILLTGDTMRWSDKTQVWKQGWRNVHNPSSPRVTAKFHAGGKKGLVIDRIWSGKDDVSDATTTAQFHGEKRSDLVGIDWVLPLDLYRPILSYNELGMIGAGPSKLFDALTAVLGLESLGSATKTLAEARLTRQKLHKEAKKTQRALLPALKQLDDPRARTALEALKKPGWDLDALSNLEAVPDVDHDVLQKLATLYVPDEEGVLAVAGQLESAHNVMAGLDGTTAQRADRMIQLLTTALEHHQQHGDGPCPVCAVGAIDREWRNSAEEQVADLRQVARQYRDAKRELSAAVQSSRKLVMPPELPDSPVIHTTALREVWASWNALPDDPGEMSEHLIAVYEDVVAEATEVVRQADSQLSERERKWSEVQPRLMSWLQSAREATAQRDAVRRIQAAEAAIKKATAAVRASRWNPIETRALELWEGLRLQSNVDLQSVKLAGSGTRRRVDLPVTVDGADAPALAVASQGELSCLALSLFFPRATLPDSPFRFLVIDDPIQAMDPARVDGLASVFSQIAADRQLIVFTHDDRLPESLRRLRIEHTCLLVTRHPGSVVQVSKTRDPVKQYFWDARAVALDDRLPEEIARRVVPGICRGGLEAACIETIRRRRLEEGESHTDVEERLGRANGLTKKAALALLNDRGKGNAVSGFITREWGRSLKDAFWEANRGAHGGHHGDLNTLISDCHSLAERIRRR